MWRISLVLSSVLALAAAGMSPQAGRIEELVSKKSFARISNNIIEDALSDVPELVRKYRYPLEVHNVVTEDGYILGVHRIPHGRDRNNVPSADKPVVFLMHGLISSSADYVLMGPGCSLAYVLAEEGYDVWLGNARGNYYSRRHTKLNPNGIFDTRFWDFSWEEIGIMDLPSMIDYVLATTGKDKLHYIGHSQGTTAFFVMGSSKPEYNDKIISMQALAPVAYMAHNENSFFKALAPYSRQIETLGSLIGIGEFFPNSEALTWAGINLCIEEALFPEMCTNILILISGWNEDRRNATMLPVKLGHTPAGAAVKQFAHYGQSIHDKEFRRYDYGPVHNLFKYKNLNPPSFDMSKITAPVFLHYSDSDSLAHVNDVYRLYSELHRPVLLNVPDKTFGHVDFVWGTDAKSLVYDEVLNRMKSFNN